MHRALYRTWRPQTFDEVSGQKHVTDILRYQVKEQKTSHAYLFCGSRGTGKTSCAKILAKAVNCLNPVNGNPCNCCDACKMIDAGLATDVIEMDAASNNGVDNVRDLKEEISFMPASLKHRVYIIDEVHMMTGSAFNALLKTLEEPPEYIVFILATTELNKLPATIISRCQRCDFRRIPTTDIMDRLSYISKEEGFDLKEDGARMIARASQGGMRDAVSLLELCSSSNESIDEELVSSVLGVGNKLTYYKTVESIFKKDYDALYKTVEDIVMSSGDLASFFLGLGDVFRDLIVYKTISTSASYLDLTDIEKQAVEILSKKVNMETLLYLSSVIEETIPNLQKTGISKRTSVEIALTRMCDLSLSTSNEALLARLSNLEKKITLGSFQPSQNMDLSASVESISEVLGEIEKPKVKEKAPETKVEEAPVKELPKVSGVKNWKSVVNDFSTIYPMYSALFNRSRAQRAGEELQIFVMDHFLLSMVEKNNQVLASLLELANRTEGENPLKRVLFNRVGEEEIDKIPDESDL